MTMEIQPHHVKASDFKARCLALMDEVSASGESIIITKNGIPVAQLSPLHNRPKTLRGALKGKMPILGNIVTSPLEGTDWEQEMLNEWDEIHGFSPTRSRRRKKK